MKKIKILLLVLLVILTTGCGNRKAATPDEFKEKAKDYTVNDVLSTFSFAEEAYEVKGNNNLVVYYVKCKTTDTVRSIYYDEITNVSKRAAAELVAAGGSDYEFNENDINVGDIIEYQRKDFSVIHRVIDKYSRNGEVFLITKGDNYTISTYNLKDKYYRISWIDDTYVYGSVDSNHKTELNDFMKSLNY